MQRRTVWGQSISCGLTSMRAMRASGATIFPPWRLPATGLVESPIFGASMVRADGVRRDGLVEISGDVCRSREGLGGEANPIPFQLNVPTHCISA